MFDNGAGRSRGAELRDKLICRVCVVDVVVGEFFSLKLNRGGYAEAFLARRVEGRLLMWVLAIAELLAQRSGKAAPTGGSGVARFRGLFCKPSGNGRIIGGGAGESDLGESFARLRADATGFHLRQNGKIVLRIDDHRDPFMVLGGGADHGRPADVDILYRFVV